MALLRNLAISMLASIAILFIARTSSAEGIASPASDANALEQRGASADVDLRTSAAGAIAAASSDESNGWDLVAESLFLWRDNRLASGVAGDFDVGIGPRVILTRSLS